MSKIFNEYGNPIGTERDQALHCAARDMAKKLVADGATVVELRAMSEYASASVSIAFNSEIIRIQMEASKARRAARRKKGVDD